MGCLDLSDDPSHSDRLPELVRPLRPLGSAGPSSDIFHGLQTIQGSNASTYPANIEPSSNAISNEDLALLDLDHDDMLLSGLGTSSAMGINCDELGPLLEHSEKWSLPSEPNLSSWKLHEFPSAEHAPVLQQDEPDDASGKMYSGNSEAGKLKLNWCVEESKQDVRREDVGGAKIVSSSDVENCLSIAMDSPEEQGLSRNSGSPDDLLKQLDSSDNSDAMEDDEGDKFSPSAKAPMSKNLVSERRRRKKLNERLYSLRAIVPKISKMDKASIVADAISYVRDLKKQVEDMQNDILTLKSNSDTSPEGPPNYLDDGMAMLGGCGPSKRIPEHKILELEVSKMEEQTYHLRIHCKKEPGVLVQLTRALEALDFEIVNANLTSVSNHILNTIVVKVKNGEMLKTEELRKMTLDVIPKFGLHL